MADDLRGTIDHVGTRFDLGEYEVAAYLAVLDQGELTASAIADRTEIPQPRVYDTVRSLADRGLVELRESRPMKVVAIDPEEALSPAASALDTLIGDLSDRYTAPARETEAVALVKSRSTILRYLREVIESAEYELVISLTPSLLDRFEAELEGAVDAGVSVNLLLTPASRAPAPHHYGYQAVATTVRTRRGITTPILAVADGTYSLYATQDALRDDADRYGVIFHRSSLGFLVSGFFSTVLWSTAEPVDIAGKRRPFPRRYASVRRAVKDMTAIEGPVYAAVSGRQVTSGDPVELTGAVAASTIEDTEEVASFTLETDAGAVQIGGLLAALEDVEAHEVLVDTSPIDHG
jgi:transcriptional regulator